jgi:hypothetical protein
VNADRVPAKPSILAGGQAAPFWPRAWVAAGIVVGGIALGAASAWLVLKNPWSAQSVRAGAWKTSTVTGSVDADPYTRARVAVGGLLALSREETLYYVADRDDAGRPLRSGCGYRIEGTPPPARWWSITAYADDFFLFPNEAHRYSLNGSTAQLNAKGHFALLTGPNDPNPPGAATPTHWLPTPGDRGLMFTLRLYNPGPALVATPSVLVPPSIERVGACP